MGVYHRVEAPKPLCAVFPGVMRATALARSCDIFLHSFMVNSRALLMKYADLSMNAI